MYIWLTWRFMQSHNQQKTKVKLGNYMLKPKLVKAFTVHGIAKWNFDPF